MHFHSQNLNDEGGITKSKWRHGRCWLHFGQDSKYCLGFEWGFWRPRLSIGLDLATHEYALSWNFCIGLANLYFHLEHWPLQRWLSNKIKRPDEKYGNGREIGVSVFDGAVMIDLWNDPMEHRRNDPRWWHIYLVPKDLLLGRAQYSEEGTPKIARVEVPMPERNYPATVKLYVAQWKRSRWPWPQRLMRADITPDTPIPFPGKGENSWDCGEDATYSLCCMAHNEHEAVSTLVASVLRSRYKYGGKNWRPAAVSVK